MLVYVSTYINNILSNYDGYWVITSTHINLNYSMTNKLSYVIIKHKHINYVKLTRSL